MNDKMEVWEALKLLRLIANEMVDGINKDMNADWVQERLSELQKYVNIINKKDNG